MNIYDEIIEEIDESLWEESRKKVSRWTKDVYVELLQQYIEEHPEKKEEVRSVIKQKCMKSYDNDWGEYYFSIFHSKEDCLDLIADEKADAEYYGEKLILHSQDAEVLSLLFTRAPYVVVDFLEQFPEK